MKGRVKETCALRVPVLIHRLAVISRRVQHKNITLFLCVRVCVHLWVYNNAPEVPVWSGSHGACANQLLLSLSYTFSFLPLLVIGVRLCHQYYRG